MRRTLEVERRKFLGIGMGARFLDPASWAAIGVGVTAAGEASAAAAASVAAAGGTAAAAAASGTAAWGASMAGTAVVANSLLIGGTMAGVGMYGAYASSQAQNKFMSQSYAAQNRATGAQNRMIREQQSLEQKKAISQANMIQGRIRTTAGESGLGLGGTYEALARQVDYDTALNMAINSRNTNNQFLAAASRGQPIQAQQYSPILSGLTSGIGGFSSGLQIGGNLRTIRGTA